MSSTRVRVWAVLLGTTLVGFMPAQVAMHAAGLPGRTSAWFTLALMCALAGETLGLTVAIRGYLRRKRAG